LQKEGNADGQGHQGDGYLRTFHAADGEEARHGGVDHAGFAATGDEGYLLLLSNGFSTMPRTEGLIRARRDEHDHLGDP
jgi:hypothetical protein